MAKHDCCWVLIPAEPGRKALYCGDPVKYKLVKDDDGNVHRKYDTFCPYHKSYPQEEDLLE